MMMSLKNQFGIACFYTIVVFVQTSTQASNFTCKFSVQYDEAAKQFVHNKTCSDNSVESYVDRCSVAMKKDSNTKLVANNCLLAISSISGCGKTTEFEGAVYTLCCCDTSLCNDDKFEKDCFKRAASSRVFASFALVSTMACLLRLL